MENATLILTREEFLALLDQFEPETATKLLDQLAEYAVPHEEIELDLNRRGRIDQSSNPRPHRWARPNSESTRASQVDHDIANITADEFVRRAVAVVANFSRAPHDDPTRFRQRADVWLDRLITEFYKSDLLC